MHSEDPRGAVLGCSSRAAASWSSYVCALIKPHCMASTWCLCGVTTADALGTAPTSSRPPDTAAAPSTFPHQHNLHTQQVTHPGDISRCHAEYRLVSKKGEGTFSEVLKAQCIKDGKYVAIKCMKNKFDSLDQVRTDRRGTGGRGSCSTSSSSSRGISSCRSWNSSSWSWQTQPQQRQQQEQE